MKQTYIKASKQSNMTEQQLVQVHIHNIFVTK